jgi:hypothetical protein
VELLLGDFFKRDEFVNAGVVDHDVDLAERFLFFATLPCSATAFPPRLVISSITLSASVFDDA